MREFRTLLVLLVAFGATGRAQSTSAATKATPDLTSVKKDLVSVRTMQETWYSNHNGYSNNLGVIDYKATDGVKVKVLEFNKDAYSVSGTIGDDKTASCVMFIGRVAEIPKTAGGKQARAEGEVLCDGTSEPPK